MKSGFSQFIVSVPTPVAGRGLDINQLSIYRQFDIAKVQLIDGKAEWTVIQDATVGITAVSEIPPQVFPNWAPLLIFRSTANGRADTRRRIFHLTFEGSHCSSSISWSAIGSIRGRMRRSAAELQTPRNGL
jgi:hypothetical protein